MMAVSPIDEAQLRAIRAYAEICPIGLKDARDIMEGKAEPVGRRPGRSMRMTAGFTVTFSIEPAPRLYPDGGVVWDDAIRLRHMSVAGDYYPHPELIGAVAAVLGLPPLRFCRMWKEPNGGMSFAYEDVPFFTCPDPDCGMTSFNPGDARERYCGACHKFF